MPPDNKLYIFNKIKYIYFMRINIQNSINKNSVIQLTKKIMPLVGLIILLYLILNIGIDNITNTILKIKPLYLIIPLLLNIPIILIANYEWQLLLKKQKIFVSYIKSLKTFLIGTFYGSITPGYIGQLVRIFYLKKETNEPIGKLYTNYFIFTAINTLLCFIFAFLGAILILEKFPQAFPFACFSLIAILLIYTYFIKKERGEKTLHLFIKLLIPKRLRKYPSKFIDTSYKDFPHKKDLVLPFIIGVMNNILVLSQIYILALSFNIELPFLNFILLYSISNLISFIPFSASGLGIREATLVFLLSLYGVPAEIAFVISILIHLTTYMTKGFIGFIISVAEAFSMKKTDLKLEKIKLYLKADKLN